MGNKPSSHEKENSKFTSSARSPSSPRRPVSARRALSARRVQDETQNTTVEQTTPPTTNAQNSVRGRKDSRRMRQPLGMKGENEIQTGSSEGVLPAVRRRQSSLIQQSPSIETRRSSTSTEEHPTLAVPPSRARNASTGKATSASMAARLKRVNYASHHQNISTQSAPSSAKKSAGRRASIMNARRMSSNRQQTTSIASLSTTSRDIVRQCFDNPHADIGNRIHKRVCEKRPDYKKYFTALGQSQGLMMGEILTQFLDECVANADYMDNVANLAYAYGERHVDWKASGFRPDFWVALSETLTKEAINLDQAIHNQTEVVEAWSTMISVILSHMRDGFYDRLRKERRVTRRQSQLANNAVNGTGLTVRAAGSTSDASVSPAATPSPQPVAPGVGRLRIGATS